MCAECRRPRSSLNKRRFLLDHTKGAVFCESLVKCSVMVAKFAMRRWYYEANPGKLQTYLAGVGVGRERTCSVFSGSHGTCFWINTNGGVSPRLDCTFITRTEWLYEFGAPTLGRWVAVMPSSCILKVFIWQRLLLPSRNYWLSSPIFLTTDLFRKADSRYETKDIRISIPILQEVWLSLNVKQKFCHAEYFVFN